MLRCRSADSIAGLSKAGGLARGYRPDQLRRKRPVARQTFGMLVTRPSDDSGFWLFLSRALYQLDYRHFSAVAPAGTELEDPRVAAIAIFELWGHFVEQSGYHFSVLDLA